MGWSFEKSFENRSFSFFHLNAQRFSSGCKEEGKSAKHLLIRSIFICQQLFWKFNPGRCKDLMNFDHKMTRSFGIVRRNSFVKFTVLPNIWSSLGHFGLFLKTVGQNVLMLHWIFKKVILVLNIHICQRSWTILKDVKENIFTVACSMWLGRGFYKYPCNGKPSGHTIVPPASDGSGHRRTKMFIEHEQ